jgi:hypothetical protein
MDLQTITKILDQMRREVEIPVKDGDVERLLLATHGKPWRIVTGHGVFDADRAHERWIVPIPTRPVDWMGRGEPAMERVYKIARVRINAKANDYTAFYDLETTRYA